MVAEKSCNLSEKRVDLPQEKGSGTSWASSEHLSIWVIPVENT